MNLTTLHNMKRRRVGVLADSDEFDSAFIEAATIVLQDIENGSPSLDPNLVNAHTDETNLGVRYLTVLSAGIDHYMSVNSQFKREGTQDLFALYTAELGKVPMYDREDNSTLNGRRGVATG